DCGSCVARCVSGAVSVADDRPLPIDPEELADGFCPTCLTRLASDVRLVLPYPLGEAPPAPGRQRARVAGVERLARTVSRLWLELDEAAGFAFQPGQYLRLRVPGVRAPRAYSIASTRADLPRVELLIRHVPGGEVTRWLESTARTGDMVGLHGP